MCLKGFIEKYKNTRMLSYNCVEALEVYLRYTIAKSLKMLGDKEIEGSLVYVRADIRVCKCGEIGLRKCQV